MPESSTPDMPSPLDPQTGLASNAGASGYIFGVEDNPTNIVVENGQIKLASKLLL